jgi:hypothetical protein
MGRAVTALHDGLPSAPVSTLREDLARAADTLAAVDWHGGHLIVRHLFPGRAQVHEEVAAARAAAHAGE